MMKTKNLVKLCLFIVLLSSLSYRVLNPEWILYHKGERLYAKEDYKNAYRAYMQAIEKGLPLEPVFNHLNIVSLKLNRTMETEKLYLKDIKDRNSFYAYRGIIDLYLNLNRIDDTINIYYNLLQKFPEEPVLNVSIARMLTWNKELTKAQKEYYKAINNSHYED